MESNTHQATTPADSPAPSDPNTHQVTAPADSPASSGPNTLTAPADFPVPSDLRGLPPTLNCADELVSDRGSLTGDKGLSGQTHVRDAHDAPGENETLSRGQRA